MKFSWEYNEVVAGRDPNFCVFRRRAQKFWIFVLFLAYKNCLFIDGTNVVSFIRVMSPV